MYRAVVHTTDAKSVALFNSLADAVEWVKGKLLGDADTTIGGISHQAMGVEIVIHGDQLRRYFHAL